MLIFISITEGHPFCQSACNTSKEALRSQQSIHILNKHKIDLSVFACTSIGLSVCSVYDKHFPGRKNGAIGSKLDGNIESSCTEIDIENGTIC